MKGRKSFHVPGARRHFLPDREYQTEHIKVELKVDPEMKTIEGRCSLKIRPLREVATVHFDAAEMKVTAVQLDGLRTRFDHDGQRLSVRTNVPMNPTSHLLVIDYSASPVHGAYFVHPDEKYPAKPVQVWTQSESEAARYWYPCYDHPNDKSPSEMVLTVPEGFQAISNGRLVSTKTDGGWTTYHWHESAPHSTYLNSFVVGKFHQIDDLSGRVPIHYHVPEGKVKDAARYFGKTPEMMKVFEDISGIDYPFERYAQVAVHDFIYGGMENITATTLVDNRFPDEQSEEDYAARYSRPDRDHIELVAHELAHMWFGDLVTVRHWPHSWLNEGFATYMEAVYAERTSGADAFRQNMLYKALSYFEEDGERYRRAIVDDDYLYADDLFDACTYEKAAWMIHQLRGMVGDELFFAGTQEYLRRYALGNVETGDYRRVMEEVSGLSLGRYFEQSFFKGGHPELEIAYSWDEAGKMARLEVKQVQQTDDLTPLFVLPAEFVFYTQKGRLVRKVTLSSQSESFQFELDSEPRIVEFDPEGWLLKKLKFRKTHALLREQLVSSRDMLSRKSAAEELASFKDRETVGLLKAAATTEQFWSVRAEAIRSIGKIGGSEALDAILSLLSVNPRRVRRAAIAALSEFKGEARAEEAAKRALMEDESTFNRCEAALTVGKLRPPDAVQVLSSSMKVESPEFALTEASLEALGYTKREEVRAILMANLAYGSPQRARIGSLKGLAKLGSLEAADVETLKEIALKDPDFIVRDQLLEVVSELGERRFAETLARVAELDADNRNRRRAVEILEDFASGEPSKAAAELRDEMEKLKTEGRELRDTLSRMERV
jgi:aminopeptidase N